MPNLILEGNCIVFKSVKIYLINIDNNRARNLIKLFMRMLLLRIKNRVFLEKVVGETFSSVYGQGGRWRDL